MCFGTRMLAVRLGKSCSIVSNLDRHVTVAEGNEEMTLLNSVEMRRERPRFHCAAAWGGHERLTERDSKSLLPEVPAAS